MRPYIIEAKTQVVSGTSGISGLASTDRYFPTSDWTFEVLEMAMANSNIFEFVYGGGPDVGVLVAEED